MKTRRSVTVVTILAAVLTPSAARAYDTGPHFDITCDALKAEGFGASAIQAVQVANFLNDFYGNASQNPFSGYTVWWKELLSGAFISKENWPASLVKDAARFHFDSDPKWTVNGQERSLDSAELLTMEWDRLARATRAQAIEAANNNDVMALLVVLGISTHCAQDFYAHTNWVEPKGKPGFDGPGWATLPDWGSHPTWYDVADSVRKQQKLYVCSAAPGLREHGYWDSDKNANLATAINKDWPGRPCYLDSYLASYFATRQWVRAVRVWVNNEPFWTSAMNANTSNWGVPADWKGAHEISFYSGLWTGGGQPTGADHPGPAGSLDDLINAISNYHLGTGKTTYRSKYEKIAGPMASANPPASATPVMASQYLQANTEFIVLSVNYVRDATPTGTIGIDPGLDEADFYANARIADQDFTSGMIHGEDEYSFPLPTYPFTFVKAVPKGVSIDEPLVALQAEIETADDLYAGTDDDVYFAIAINKWWNLDLPLYNDLERGDKDTYVFAVPPGTLVKDINFIELGKKPDGVGGGWKLGGIKVMANGDLFYEKHGIDTWLEKSSLVWQAPNFTKKTPKTTDIPITLSLYDSDGFLYGKDDHCDINFYYGLYDLNLLYNPNTGAFRGDFKGTGAAKTTGGEVYGGLGNDDDRCDIGFALKRVPVVLATKLPPPELVIGVLGPIIIPATTGTKIEGEDAEVVTAWQPPPVKQVMLLWGNQWSNNAQLWYPAKESGGRFAIYFSVPDAGTYALSVALTKGPDYGGLQVALDGTPIGERFDGYDAKVCRAPELALGTFDLTQGKHELAFLVTGKSRQSAGFMAGLDYIVVTPAAKAKALGPTPGPLPGPVPGPGPGPAPGTAVTNPDLLAVAPAAPGGTPIMIEAEDATVTARSGGTTVRQDMSQYGNQWSNNAHLWFRAGQAGARAALKISVPQTRGYAISAFFTKAPDYGIVRVALDGKPLGSPFDGYAASVTRSEEVKLGSVELTQGDHEIGFEVVGKNPSSTYYLVGVDAIILK